MALKLEEATLGFAEFVGTLISEAFEAITTSQVQASEKIAEIQDQLTLSEDEFMAAFIDDSDVDDALRSIFQVETLAGLEWNQVTRNNLVTALTIDNVEFTESPTNGVLISASRARIDPFVKRALARRKRRAQALLLRGNVIPTLVVESGEIKARLTFAVQQIVSDTEAPSPPQGSDQGGPRTTPRAKPPAEIKSVPRATIGAPLIFKGDSGRVILFDPKSGATRAESLQNVRLTVKPSSQKTSNETNADVYGEVLIRFKAI